MPVFNGVAHLPATVESILGQRFTDFEYVIVDDGSSDGSWDILCDYAARDKRIVLQRNQTNIGACATSNRILELAYGQYIARTDQDDLSLPDRIGAQVAYLDASPKVGLLGTAYFRLSEDGERRLRLPPPSHTGIRWRLLFNCPYCHSSIMLRRSLFDTGELYYKELSGAQDYELWVRLASCTQAATLEEPLVIYRELAHGMTALEGDRLSLAALEVSARQIRGLVPASELPLEKIDALCRLHSPRDPGETEIAMAPAMYDLLDAFSRQSGVDETEVIRIRRRWVRRMLTTVRPGAWPALWRSGLPVRALQADLQAVLLAGTADVPRKILRRVR